MHPHHSSGRAAWLRPNMGPGLSNGLRRGKPQTAAPILQDNQSCTTSLFTPRLLSYEVLGNPSNVFYKRVASTSESPAPKPHQKVRFGQLNISTTAQQISLKVVL
jgi:hypothetical protein